MFLKSIEIRGFKSFADKTELTFKKGITAVVGPNGSGKSNISDAVRWVLGEQSVRSLRGDKMEDVIFAGTQFRKPVSLAQVALTLDNSDCKLNIDYSNVTIARRLYRSGESEYLINNTSCRLKDVQQLFMDTGIGKEGYSIIGQGKIDAILSGKTEERRKLFEEAAGIVKFKSRKEEAEKKLDLTQQNLIRIEDILSTYEERLEPLMIESEKAKKFLKYFEELKSKEVSIIVDAIDKVEKKIKITKDECSRLKLEVIKITEEKSQLKSDVEYWNSEFEKFENKNKEEKQLYYDNKLIYQNSNSEINILKERIENLVKLIDKTSKDSDDINEQLTSFKLGLRGLENSLSNIRNTNMEIEDRIQSEQIKINIIEQDIEVESAETKNLKEEDQISKDKTNILTNKLLILNNNIETSKRKIDLLKNDIESFNSSIKNNAAIKIVIQREMKEFKEKILHYEIKLKENRQEVNKLQNILNNDETIMKNYNFKVNKTEANFNVLKVLEKKHEGYNKSVKNLIEHINEGKVASVNDCFVLGEIIKVDKNMEVAIEIALGGSISHVITKDETVAKLLINYLKQNNLGRATFLPLNIIKGKMLTIDNETKNHAGFVGIASELIEYHEKFSEVISFILGRTIICKDMDSALKISKRNNFRYKIVTLSGEVINLGGSLTGGSVYSKTSSIIGRKREIEELDSELRTLKGEAVIYLEKIKQGKYEILSLEEENVKLKDQVHIENIEKTKLESKINALENETSRLENSMMTLNTEKFTEENKLKDDKSEVEEKNMAVCDLTRARDEMQQIQSVVGLKLKDKLQEIENIKARIIDAKIKKAGIEEIIRNKISEIQRLNEEMLVYNEKVIICSKEIQEAVENKNISETLIKNGEEKASKILDTLAVMEKNFEDSEIQRIKIKEKIKTSVEQLDNASLFLEKTEKDMYKCQMIFEKTGMEKENYYQKLNEDFELTYAESLEFKNEIEDIGKLKGEILTLKGNIQMLGKVNVGAIEEYKEVKEKFTFMDVQKQDLVLSKDELSIVICEMTKKMKEMFAENFDILRQNFHETFMELFKGGSADLILTDGDELTAKIDINVQPPGKKLQNISLMSGGEKVLSAIALLFAILKMKPTPFCILDEIEAALDDANVVRYAEFLTKFSDQVQFIIITHRKGTMEASDVLYGVTMEEKGVSKIVSVDFNK